MDRSSTLPRQIKSQIFEQLARIAKAAASPGRLELLELLAQGDRTVEAIARRAGLSVANASRHLRVLWEAGLVETAREGQFVRYRLAGPEVFELLRAVRTVAARRNAQLERLVQQYLKAWDSLEPITSEELLRRARDGTVTVVDVRPPEEYAASHLPGAVSIPLDELKRQLARLPDGREVVAYCRGPYCLLAFQAVEILRNHGLKARRLESGLPDWRAQGLPTECGPSGRGSVDHEGSHRSQRRAVRK
ncbi:MAG: metalloregulator ArsR/SmtB family transcription factor [Candidatus Riflebacteria bacterium]|nr:metalloregulator ArsR/SmtB family transcription factor [Candidatus Riflebacteria bacterium]